jgi:hypothetical protein
MTLPGNSEKRLRACRGVAATKPAGSPRSPPRVPNSLSVPSMVPRSAAVLAGVSGVIKSDTFNCTETLRFS